MYPLFAGLFGGWKLEATYGYGVPSLLLSSTEKKPGISLHVLRKKTVTKRRGMHLKQMCSRSLLVLIGQFSAVSVETTTQKVLVLNGWIGPSVTSAWRTAYCTSTRAVTVVQIEFSLAWTLETQQAQIPFKQGLYAKTILKLYPFVWTRKTISLSGLFKCGHSNRVDIRSSCWIGIFSQYTNRIV